MLRAQDVMKSAAALLNDQGLLNDGVPTLFTYTAQIPYLNIALGELREILEQYNVQATNATITSLIVPAGTTEIPEYDPNISNSLPKDLIGIQHLWERTEGQTEDYLDMQRLEFLPPYSVQTTCLVYWTYQDQKLKFVGATSNRQLRMDYIADKLPDIIDPTDAINLINAQSFLIYRTAALCAEFIGENTSRANSLNSDANLSLDRFLQIGIKDKQAIPTRRRPFLSGYRGRGYC